MGGKTGAILARCVEGLALLILIVVATDANAHEGCRRKGAADQQGRCDADVTKALQQTQCCACKNCQRGPRGPAVHCGMPAPSYPVPFATPRPNLQTVYTYPPMMPHNSLQHYAGTYAFRHGPGMSRTTVTWRPTKGLNALAYLHHLIELPR